MRLILPASVLLATLGPLTSCARRQQVPVNSPATVQAQLVRSETKEVPQLLRAMGTVHAIDTAIISAQVPGRITDVLVREGGTVQAGQLLLSLDDASLRAGVEQAHAAFVATQKEQLAAQTDAALAASTLTRYQVLKDQKSVSPQEFDEIEKRSEAAQQRLEAQKAQTDAAQAAEQNAVATLGYAHIHSPFAGVVTRRMADPGTLASPGVPLLEIDKAGPLQLDVTVDESMIAAVQASRTLSVEMEGITPSELTAAVAQIVPAVDPATRSFLVKLSLPATRGLQAGMFGSAMIRNGNRTSINVPKSALAMRGSLACVYVLDSQAVAQLRYVTVGAMRGTSIEVLSGLSPGETLIDSPGDRDLSGKKVEARP